jgi:glutamate-ammonia-ligase adenylyltransferase
VKLGSGGIRDVELVAQVLQLLNAGRRRELRERTTLPALTKLALAGLLTDEEARTLATAYQFLRRIEHRLQLQDGAQTQSLPTQPAALEVLARRLGFPAAEAFLDELDRTRTAVSAIAATLGEPTAGPSALVLRLLDPAAAPERLDADLAQAGFHDRRAGAEALALAGGRMPPSWLTETLASPDPDRALGRFRDLALRGSHGLFRWLEAERPLLRMLAALFGTSERLGGLLLGNPALWEPLLLGLGAPRPEVASWKERLATRLAALDEEEALREARRFQAEEILRTGLHDAAGTLAVHEVSAQLTLLAEACLATAIDRVADTLARRYGAPEAELVVLGMGSLGARELRYGSDLDLVFLFSREGTTTRGMDHAEWFARLAQRLISALGALLDEGRLYEVDTRLRPSGAQGMLVTTTASFDRYHHDDAAPWERAALVRSRVVYARRLGETAKIAATTAEADGAFPARLEAITYERPFDRATMRRELLHMRHRMEAERAGAGAVNLRLGAGGLADLELIAAVGQLEGAGDRRLRTTETLVALERLAVAGWSPPELVGDCRFLLAAISKLRLLRERPDDRVLAPDRAALARALGLDEADLVAQITTRMRRARHELCRLVGEPRPRP